MVISVQITPLHGLVTTVHTETFALSGGTIGKALLWAHLCRRSLAPSLLQARWCGNHCTWDREAMYCVVAFLDWTGWTMFWSVFCQKMKIDCEWLKHFLQADFQKKKIFLTLTPSGITTTPIVTTFETSCYQSFMDESLASSCMLLRILQGWANCGSLSIPKNCIHIDIFLFISVAKCRNIVKWYCSS